MSPVWRDGISHKVYYVVPHFNNISEQKLATKCFFSEVEVMFSRAVKPVTLVRMMDALWAARFSQHYRESPWAVKQALVIDAVSPAILFTLFPLLYCIFSNFFHSVGRNTR